MARNRFDIDLLDPDDPFEIDRGNEPHLYKHIVTTRGRQIAIGPEDLLDMYHDNPRFFPASEDGPADWLMVAEVPGTMLMAPLAPPTSDGIHRCRPVGLYAPSMELRRRYRQAVG